MISFQKPELPYWKVTFTKRQIGRHRKGKENSNGYRLLKQNHSFLNTNTVIDQDGNCQSKSVKIKTYQT